MRSFALILKVLICIMIVIGIISVIFTGLEVSIGICSLPAKIVNHLANDETVDEAINIKEYKDVIGEVILGEGHPLYYGKINKLYDYANKFRNNAIAVDIVGGDNLNKYTDQTFLYVKGYEYNEIVTDIEIYLKNMAKNIKEKDAFTLARYYLNNEMIKENFVESEYNMYEPKDKSNSTYKVITYELNTKGKKAQDSGEFETMGRFFVTLEEKNNKIKTIRIHDITSIPGWMSKSKLNGYKVSSWPINK